VVKPAKAEGEPARTPGPPGAARTHTGAQTLVMALGMVLVASSAGVSRVSTSAAVPLPCKEALAEGSAQVIPRLDSGYKVVLGRLALPTGNALQAGPSGESDPGARLFAKAGLVVKSGAEFELAVPRRWQGRLAIGWGPMRRTVRLRVAGCNRQELAHFRWWLLGGRSGLCFSRCQERPPHGPCAYRCRNTVSGTAPCTSGCPERD